MEGSMPELMKRFYMGIQGEAPSREALKKELVERSYSGDQAKVSSVESMAEEILREEPMEELLKRAKALPRMCTPGAPGFQPEIWTVSYTTISNLGWMLRVKIEHFYTEHDYEMVIGKGCKVIKEKPSKEVVVRALLDSMLNPSRPEATGPPHRPFALLLAYRLRNSFQYIAEHMHQIDVLCEFETEEAAIASSQKEGTCPDGRNGISCDNCDKAEGGKQFSRCSACRSARYCSKECQTDHWANAPTTAPRSAVNHWDSGHKKECKKRQQK
eukprot:gene7273-385_t